MSVKRVVDTRFWTNERVMDQFSVEDKFFMLYLMTCPRSSQLGIYALPKRLIAFETGYTSEVISVLLERFEQCYDEIRYSNDTQEITVLHSLLYSIVKGGAPLVEQLRKELTEVRDTHLIEVTLERITPQLSCSQRPIDLEILRLMRHELARRSGEVSCGLSTVAEDGRVPSEVSASRTAKQLTPYDNETDNDHDTDNVNVNVNVNDNDNDVSPTDSWGDSSQRLSELLQHAQHKQTSHSPQRHDARLDSQRQQLHHSQSGSRLPQTHSAPSDTQTQQSHYVPLASQLQAASSTGATSPQQKVRLSFSEYCQRLGVAAGEPSDIDRLVACYEKHFGNVNQKIRQRLTNWLYAWSLADLQEAIFIAVRQHATSPLAYIEGVLHNWITSGKTGLSK